MKPIRPLPAERIGAAHFQARRTPSLPVLVLTAATTVEALMLSACSGDAGGQAPARTSGEPRRAHLVELAEVREQPLRYTADRRGSLRALRQVKVFNQEEGLVKEVLVRQGDPVGEAQVLVRLDDSLLRAEFDKAAASRTQAELDARRLEGLRAKKLVAEETYSRALTALAIARAEERLLRTRIGYMTIRAPFAGKIAERLIEPGDVAPKHNHLLTLIDPSSLVTEVQVSELIMPYLKVGQRADVRIDALGDTVYLGRILRIYPTIDAATRQGRLEIALEPVPSGARPGQFCRVTLHTDESRHLVIPLSAVQRDENGEYVFRLSESSTVHRAPVESGIRFADMVEIRAGLTPGQRVVTKGFLGLAEGQTVKPVDTMSLGRDGGA